MILNELKVINPPDNEWLTRLRKGHFVWAVKEKRFAQIDWAWEPPNPGCVSGRIGIRLCWSDMDQWGLDASYCPWFIKPDGTGFDGKVLLSPVAENCPDEAPTISEPWQRHIERTLGQILHRLEQMESNHESHSSRTKEL